MEAERPTIESATVGPVTWVKPAGEFDLAVCDDLEQAICASAAPQGSVYLDLSEVTFIDASVLGALVRAGARLAAQESRLKIFGAAGFVAELLTLSGISKEYGVNLQIPDVHAETAPSPPTQSPR